MCFTLGPYYLLTYIERVITLTIEFLPTRSVFSAPRPTAGHGFGVVPPNPRHRHALSHVPGG